ncbi:MAG: glycoside hydrolase family 92 protein [Clostridia bacterium]|nr:glycoside hydrolase family 92 protein [Clostridia bacterium]
MRDYSRRVDVFYGCDEITPHDPAGTIAAKWFFLKAGCGNTSPAATVPFGAVSVGPYSGGYPTGYLDHLPNSHSRPARFPEGRQLLGFSHLHHSGVGAVGYYYNYCVVTPRYPSSPVRRAPQDETASPGYYAVTLEDIRCELTTTGRAALHRYAFGSAGGCLHIDLSNNGLCLPGDTFKSCDVRTVRIEEDAHCALVEFEAEGVTFYLAVRCSRLLRAESGVRLVSDFAKAGETVTLSVAFSLRSLANARALLPAADFDAVRADADRRWNALLSRIRIESALPETEEIFYSALYHSLAKPTDWSGESFLYPGDGPFLTDFITLWDMYKTQLPLVFLLDREIGEKAAETLLRLSETLGTIPNALGLTADLRNHAGQARMLGDYALLTAYHYGVRLDPARMLRAIERDLFSPENADFLAGQPLGSETWTLDLTELCALAAAAAESRGDPALAARLRPHAARWRAAFDPATGLLRADSSYYEGSLWNYSFRPMVEMEERMALAGGKDAFTALLDRFFGYGAPDTVQPTDPYDPAPVQAGLRLGRFEGFNNESDLEAPFAYHFAGRRDRLCEILRAGMTKMFAPGRGGIPGNNDSGALTSYYIFAALGLFPLAGQDRFLLGSPLVDRAEIDLFNGNTLRIEAHGNSPAAMYVRAARWNGAPLPAFELPARALLQGGTLEFDMAEKTTP